MREEEREDAVGRQLLKEILMKRRFASRSHKRTRVVKRSKDVCTMHNCLQDRIIDSRNIVAMSSIDRRLN